MTEYEKHMTPDVTKMSREEFAAHVTRLESEIDTSNRTAALAIVGFLLVAFGSMAWSAYTLFRWVLS